MKAFILLGACLLSLLPVKAQNQDLSNGIVFDGEPYIAVNPDNPRHMVVAWMGYVFLNRIMIRTRVSFDGGNTWSTVRNTPHVASGNTAADPSIAFDNIGNVFLSLIDYDPYFTSGAVYVLKSTDGGLNWGNPVEVIAYDSDPGMLPIDRPWIAADRSGGPYDGNLYITTISASGANGPPYHPYFIRSADHGNSFEPWRYADTTGWLSGSLIPKPMATPAVSSDGTFHCIYPSYVLSQNFLPQFIHASSADGGYHFEYHTVISSGTAVAVSDTSAKKGYLLRVDPANPEHMAFVFLSNQNGDPDVYCLESFDEGQNWSSPLKVNDDDTGNGRMQDLVWAAFDTDGDLLVSWRDRRHAADTGYAASYEIYGAVKRNNSGSFLPNFRISDQSIPFNEILLLNGNDFMCAEIIQDTISAVWGDTRNGYLNIWFQRLTTDGTPLEIRQLAREALPPVEIKQTGTEGIFRVRADGLISIDVVTIAGRQVVRNTAIQGSNEATINLSNCKAGVYIFIIHTGNGKILRKVVIPE